MVNQCLVHDVGMKKCMEDINNKTNAKNEYKKALLTI